MSNQTYQPTQQHRRRRWVPFVAYPAVFAIGLVIGISANGGTSTSSTAEPSAAATQSTTAPPETSVSFVPETTPAYVIPLPKDIQLRIKIKQKQCFGSAGCNVVYQVDANWTESYNPSVTYDVTYEVRGGEDGPVINTMTITGDNFTHETDEMVSTKSKNTKLTAVVTSVDAQ